MKINEIRIILQFTAVKTDWKQIQNNVMIILW